MSDVSSPKGRTVRRMFSRVDWVVSQAVSSPSPEVCKERLGDHLWEMLWEGPWH